MPVSDSSDAKTIDLNQMHRKRGYIKARVTRLKNFIDEFDSSIHSSVILNVRLQKLDDCWKDYNSIQTEIQLVSPNEEEEEAEQIQFENKYYEVRDKIEELLENTKKPLKASTFLEDSNISTTATPARIKLPELALPKFSGKFDEWLDFYHVYMDMIHNSTNLTPIQKFYYLRSCLTNEALKVIQEIKATPENYESAWSLITHRFHNKRLIIKTHVQAILDLKSIDKPTATGLREIYDTVNNRITALTNIGEPTEYWGTLLENIILNKIDNNTRNNWEVFIVKLDQPLKLDGSHHELFPTQQTPPLDTFMTFLNRQCRIQEALEENSAGKIKISASLKNATYKKFSTQKNSTAYVSTKERCFICTEYHTLSNCGRFQSLTETQRLAKAREFKLCLNCLRQNHKTINCKSPFNCKLCQKRHHSLLHLKDQCSQPISIKDDPQRVVSGHSTSNQDTILATAMVNIADSSGKLCSCRALLDSGSQSNFIKQSLANYLGLRHMKTNISISGIDSSKSEVKFMVKTKIKSKVTNYEDELEFLILRNITSDLPSCTLPYNVRLPSSLHLADEGCFESRSVDILLGAEVFYDLLTDGQLKLGPALPILQNTVFGWVVGGRVFIEKMPSIKRSFLATKSIQTENLENLLASFWQIEENTNEIPRSYEEEECEMQFLKTTKRQDDGRFNVTLPFSQDPRSLGISRPQAYRRFLALERRLDRDCKLKEAYTDFLNEYLENDEMELIQNQSEPEASYYLPHHPVIKESSSTTRLRVVFDASAKTSTGNSLNDILMVGPTMQRDLFSILLSFRLHKFVFTSDIKQMYRRILVNENQRDFQRILWRENPTDPILTYRLKTVTYGTASAPYLAVRTLFKLADDEENQFPLAAPVLRNDFYVDDVLTGSDNLEELMALQKQLIQILAKGNFELRKWCSNNHSLIRHLPQEHLEANFSINENNNTVKTLGIHWQPKKDTFNFKVHLEDTPNVITKRIILADISRLFDPMGFVTPVLITAKLFMQEIWCEKELQWDDPVPEAIVDRWLQYRNKLMALNQITIVRRVLNDNKAKTIQLHGFSDASMKAYGAVIYVRTVLENGEGAVSLLCSKSRVAPLKSLALPRLELCGALLLAKLVHKCIASLRQLHIENIILWTDSTIVLHWLNASPHTWQTFVANRVSQIQTMTSESTWKHVRSNHNPADLITRSISPEVINKCAMWWNGPDWLTLNECRWPKSIWTTNFDSDIEERRRLVNVAIRNEEFNFVERYSSWEKLLRIVAFCKRFAFNCRHPDSRIITALSINDYAQAESILIKNLQSSYFEKELEAIRNNKEVSNQIKPLSPFIDNEGLLRVGGRLRNANIDFNHKNQILLPKNHHITRLIFDSIHKKTCHSGPQLLLSTIRTKYWPLSGRAIARSIVRKCIKCSRTNPTPFKQIMGDLPSYRVQPATPFYHCGVDYCGPIYFKRILQRRSNPVKAYVALFICMSTKAIHLELVPDLTTKKFLDALQRMQARRGKIKYIYSDNGTNFVGARNHLNELKQMFESDHDQVNRYCASEGITWNFIPPRSPHFGGLWESGVRNVKGHLKRVVGNQILTYDELETLLILIESCVNSRPLTAMSDNPNDLNPITPAHFLVGQSLTSLPVTDLTNVNSNHLSRWQLVQQLQQSFWKRWKNEYLATLQPKGKWRSDHPPPPVGTLVLLKDEIKSPLQWELGRISELHPGPDGRVRVVTVKTKKGQTRRCIVKLCPLPKE